MQILCIPSTGWISYYKLWRKSREQTTEDIKHRNLKEQIPLWKWNYENEKTQNERKSTRHEQRHCKFFLFFISFFIFFFLILTFTFFMNQHFALGRVFIWNFHAEQQWMNELHTREAEKTSNRANFHLPKHFKYSTDDSRERGLKADEICLPSQSETHNLRSSSESFAWLKSPRVEREDVKHNEILIAKFLKLFL